MKSRRGKERKAPLRKKSTRFEKPEPTEVYPKLDLRDVYKRQCLALGVKPNTQMLCVVPDGKDSDTCLEVLDAGWNYLGDKGSRALLEVIKMSQNLKAIQLSSNGITDTTVEMLGTVLARHPAVTAIDLSNNKITQEAVPAIKKLIRENKRIAKIELRGNTNMYEATLNDIDRLLMENGEAGTSKMNKSLRQILCKFSSPAPSSLARKQGFLDWATNKTLRKPVRNIDGWAPISVFIGSTFSDFHTEQHVIANRILPELNLRLRKHKIYLLPIDLHQNKQYNCDSIENIQNVKYCIGTLRRSSDIFIGLFGEVLGWVPSVDEIPNYQIYSKIRQVASEEPTSITYMQYLEAFKYKVDAGQAPVAFFYTRHPNVTLDIPASLKDSYCDKPHRKCWCAIEKKKIIESVPEALVYAGYGAHFKSIDRFGQVHLCRIADFEETVQSDLFNALEVMCDVGKSPQKDYTKVMKERYTRGGNILKKVLAKYHSFTNRTWVGRSELVGSTMQNILPDINDMHDSRIIVVTGPRGCGRTSLLCKVAHVAGKLQQMDVIEHYPLLKSVVPSASDIRSVVTALYTQACRIPGAPLCTRESDIMESMNTNAMPTYLWSYLSQVSRATGKPIAVVLDDVESIAGVESCLDLLGSRTNIPSSVRVLLSVPSDRKDLLNELKTIDPNHKVVPVDRLLIKERRAFLEELLSPYGCILSPADTQAIISKEASVLPMYCKLLANEILHKSTHMAEMRVISNAPDSMIGLVTYMLGNREAKEKISGGQLYFTRLCCVLSVSRAGLGDQECREILMKTFPGGESYLPKERSGYQSDESSAERHTAETKDTRRRLWGRWANTPRLLPGSIWSRLIFELRPFLHRKVEVPADYIDSYVLCYSSESIKTAVVERYLTTRKRTARFHAQLGNYYRGKLYIPYKILWRKALRECVYHLVKSWSWDTLITVLRPSFIYHVIQQGFAYELRRDFGEAEKEIGECLSVHKSDLSLQKALMKHLRSVTEYKAFLRAYTTLVQEGPHMLYGAMLTAPTDWKMAAQVRSAFASSNISYLAPKIDTFHEMRREGKVSDASYSEVSIVAGSTFLFTWAAKPVSKQQGRGGYLEKGVVYVWAHEGTLVRTLDTASDDPVVHVVLSADEEQVLIGNTWQLTLWSVSKGTMLGDVRLPFKGTAEIKGLTFFQEPVKRPDAMDVPLKSFMMWDTSGRVLLWDTFTDRGRSMTDTTNTAVDIDMSPGGAKLVVAYEDCSCVTYSAMSKTPAVVATYTGRDTPRMARFVHETSTHVITFTNRNLALWHADTGTGILQVEMDTFNVLASLTYHPKEGLIVAVDPPSGITSWNVVNDSGSVAVKQRCHTPVSNDWNTLADGLFCCTSEGTVVCAKQGIVRFAIHGSPPSSSVTFATKAPLQHTTPGPSDCVPITCLVCTPNKPYTFFTADGSSGTPLLFTLTKQEVHHGQTPLRVCLD